MPNIRKDTLDRYREQVKPSDLKEWLEEKYLVEKLSYRQIMVLLDTKNNRIIKKLLNSFGIPIRYGSDAISTQWINNDERRKGQSEWLTRVVTENPTPMLDEEELKRRYKAKGMRYIKRNRVNGRTDIQYICNKCDYIGWQDLGNLGKRGCPVCAKVTSRGEEALRLSLGKRNIMYEIEYSFKDCKSKQPLPFDFALFNKGHLIALIEYQGEQHYKPVEFFGGTKQFEKQAKHDNIKRNYCKANNIPLIEIPYWIDDIESYLDEQLNLIDEPIQLAFL